MGFGDFINVAAHAVTGYGEGELENRQRAIALAALRRKEQADADREQLARDQFEEKKQQDHIRNVIAGYTPSSTTVTTEEPGVEDATLAPKPPMLPTEQSFGDVMDATGRANAMPTTPATGPLTPPPVRLGGVPKLRVIDTPESYDPTAGEKGALARQRIDAAATARQETLDSLEARATAANKSRELTARLRAANRAAGSQGSRQITATAKERNARQAAQAYIAIHGDVDAAKTWLASPEGADARAQGVTANHLEIAAGLRKEADTHAAMGIARGATAATAVKRVRDVRTAAATPAPPPAPAPPRPVGSPAPTQPAPPPAPRTPPPAKTPDGSTRATSSGLVPLTPAQIQRAKTDPDYKAFLLEKGYKL
jgi:hypothetical protein